MSIPSSFRPKAIVFDKDGVLADSESINLSSAFEVFRSFGHELDPEDESAIVGKHPIHYVPVLAKRVRMDEKEQRRLIDEQELIYNKLWLEEGRLFEGARDALAAARGIGVGTGLATSSSRRETSEFLERFDLAGFFDVTLTLDDVTRAKPDPEMYLAAARELGVTTAEMLVIEDSEHGVRAAKSAGAFCVAVRTPYVKPERVAIADVLFDSIAELAGSLRQYHER